MSTTPAVPASPSGPASWPFWRRLGFRFLFLFVLLLCLPFPLNLIPKTEPVWTVYSDAWTWLSKQVDTILLGTGADYNAPSNGSGDRTVDFVLVLTTALASSVITAAWTLIGRRSNAYPRLAHGLWIYVRLYLGYIMLSYGLSKVFVHQFPFPTPSRLAQPVGNMSPMGLLWTFMGASPAYVAFTGVAEVLGGLLLFGRRTATAGALIVAGITTNIVMLNFCYDVPVKLFSSQLLLMSIGLALPDLRRLLAIFVLDRPTTPRGPRPALPWRRVERGVPFMKFAVLGGMIYLLTSRQLERQEIDPAEANVAAFADTLEVETFEVDGALRPPLTTDRERWKALHRGYGGVSVERMDGTRHPYEASVDPATRTLKLTPWDENHGSESPPAELLYSWGDARHVSLTGTSGGKSVKITLVRKDLDEHRLVNRGFHWVNEYPFNR